MILEPALFGRCGVPEGLEPGELGRERGGIGLSSGTMVPNIMAPRKAESTSSARPRERAADCARCAAGRRAAAKSLRGAGRDRLLMLELLGLERLSRSSAAMIAASRDWIFSATAISFCDKASASRAIASRVAVISSWRDFEASSWLLDGREIVSRLGAGAGRRKRQA